MNIFNVTKCTVEETLVQPKVYEAKLTQEEIDYALEGLSEDATDDDIFDALQEYAQFNAEFEWVDDGELQDAEYDTTVIRDGKRVNTYDLLLAAHQKRQGK